MPEFRQQRFYRHRIFDTHSLNEGETTKQDLRATPFFIKKHVGDVGIFYSQAPNNRQSLKFTLRQAMQPIE
jgi:hypothetical protein